MAPEAPHYSHLPETLTRPRRKRLQAGAVSPVSQVRLRTRSSTHTHSRTHARARTNTGDLPHSFAYLQRSLDLSLHKCDANSCLQRHSSKGCHGPQHAANLAKERVYKEGQSASVLHVGRQRRSSQELRERKRSTEHEGEEDWEASGLRASTDLIELRERSSCLCRVELGLETVQGGLW